MGRALPGARRARHSLARPPRPRGSSPRGGGGTAVARRRSSGWGAPGEPRPVRPPTRARRHLGSAGSRLGVRFPR